MPRRGVTAGAAAALLLALAAGAGAADPSDPTTSTATEPLPTATDTTTAPVETTPPPTTATTPVTTVRQETTTQAGTTTAPRPRVTRATSTAAEHPGTPAERRSLGIGCPVAAVALAVPRETPLLLAPVAAGSVRVAAVSRLLYPAGAPIVRAGGTEVVVARCTPAGVARGTATVRSVSLFGGAVAAARVTLDVGRTVHASIAGLRVAGRAVDPTAGTRVVLGSWGYAVVDDRDGALGSPGGVVTSALAVHVVKARAGLPPGSTVLVAAARVPAPPAAKPKPAPRARVNPAAPPARHRHAARPRSAKPAARRHHRHKRRTKAHEPLKATPALGLRAPVFPVVGSVDYGDSYGAFRGDVPGQWHHGDDLFAALGTPVVAVADGTLNRVGWEHLGGWRLWVRDRLGDEFYYAHLSGYTPAALRSKRVQAGDVIGFVGNTGDAFTTPPHLHFEVHPRQLLRLGYDGAVNPTPYLDRWRHVDAPEVPRPALPAVPTDPVLRKEAGYVFQELLAARHLIRHAPRPKWRPHVHVAAPEASPVVPRRHRPVRAIAASAAPAGGGLSTLGIALLASAGALGAFALAALAAGAWRRGAIPWPGREHDESDPTAGVDAETSPRR